MPDTELERLVNRCKATVTLTINDHRTSCMSVEEYWVNYIEDYEVSKECLAIMIETDTVVDLQFFPATPSVSYSVWHHDISEAVKRAHEILDDIS